MLFLAFFCGLVLLQLVYMLAYFIIFRKKVYLFYFLSLLGVGSAIVMRAYLVSVNSNLIRLQSPFWGVDLLFMQFSGLLYLKFLIHFICENGQHPKIYRLSNKAFHYLLLFFLLGVFLFFSKSSLEIKETYFKLLYIGMLPLYGYLLWVLYKKKELPGNLVLMGTLIILLVSRLYFIYLLLHHIPVNIYSMDFQYVFITVFTLNFFVVNLALILKARQYLVESKNAELLRQQELMNQRKLISSELHEDAGASLSSLYVQASVAASLPPAESEQVKNQLRIIASGVMKVMQNMNEIIWAIQEDDRPQRLFSNFIKDCFYDALDERNISCEYLIDQELEPKIKNFQVRKALLQITKEVFQLFLDKSIPQQMKLSLQGLNEFLEVEISSSGQKMNFQEPALQTQLQAMQFKALSIDGTLQFDAADESMNRVLLKIPLSRIH